MTGRLILDALIFASGAATMWVWGHREYLADEWETLLTIRNEDPRSLTRFGRMIQRLVGGYRGGRQ